jgi:hypothetical protein
MGPWVLGVVVLSVGVMAARGIVLRVERQQVVTEINRLQGDLSRARVNSDWCRNSLSVRETSLRQLGLTIDSMRSGVDDFEAMDSRGVPDARFQEYLGLFDRHNDSVAEWDVREGRLREAERTCRTTIEKHNTLTDSLKGVLEAAGIPRG